MSALDQAFIKAYAKDPPAPSAAATVVASRPLPRPPAAAAPAGAIEQLYHNAAYYRVEQPTRKTAVSTALQPHVKLLPPTSPRRGVQRSLLRLMSQQPAETPIQEAAGPPPKVARKVIIRHISHAAPPAPLGLLRSAPVAPLPPADEISELPPETIADDPPISPKPLEPSAQPIPTTPTIAPQTAPLNEIWPEVLSWQHNPLATGGHWELAESSAGMVLLAEPAEFTAAGPDSLVSVQLESLRLPEPAIAEGIEGPAAAKEEVAARFAGKTLDDTDDVAPKFRVDAPHAHSPSRPHAKFAPAVPEPELPPEPAVVAEPIQPVAEIQPVELSPPPREELTLAETPAEEATDDRVAQHAFATGPVPEPVKAVPLWEVDRFHWPKTCEKLLAADGYFVHAGEKLLAAARDGLRVLAITGSRRGEGRTTLALCLARVAAKAGIQAAIMDADFARPQLASKIGLEITHGWQDAALGKIPLSEAAVKSLADNVTALPLETSAVGARLSLADPRVTATIRAAAATFELLILDLGPVGPGEEIAFPVGERCPLDAAIVVRDLRFATLSESETIGRALADAGIEAVGIAENFVVHEELPVTSV